VKARYLPLAAGLLAALGTSVTHQTLVEKRAEFPQDEDLLYLPPPDDLLKMSLGYREALADLIWIRAVVFAGSELIGEHFSWVSDYLEVINYLAPTFKRPYSWGGKITLYTGKSPGRHNIETSERILRAGLERFPEDHEMLFSLGMIVRTERTEARGYSPEEIAAGEAESVLLIRKAAAFGAPALVRHLAASFIDEDADRELRISFLEEQLLTTENERHKRYLRNRLEELGVADNYERTMAMRQAFNAEREAQFPYLQDHEYALVRDEGARAPATPSSDGPAQK
jgi:hypothetical protein